ncbi:MAG TPA: sugar phosphate isomerase/epimerase family protein [Bryobacteraceae bacterium]|nr:sugar phosphate isomerase/epimerase family protein [Bryobacteraceae bacterium]
MPFRFSVCNEVFEKTPFGAAAKSIRKLGYEGIEIAPFTLAEAPESISQAQRAEYRRVMADEGLAFVGLHWLMVSPPGLHVTTPDLALRRRSWDHIRSLIDLCADLGDNGVMVFGSPKQRNTVGGMNPSEARTIFTEELAKVAPQAEDRKLRILVEALPSEQSNVINTLDEAVAIVDAVRSPAVRTMFDTHNAVDETEPHPAVIRKFFPYIAHVHVNEIDGREPGTGSYDFTAVFKTLHDLQYGGWISLEVFDFSRGPEAIAGGAIEFLRRHAALSSTTTERISH